MSTKSVLGGLGGYVSVLGGVYKKCLGGLSGYVTVLGGIYKKCLGGGRVAMSLTVLGGV